MVSSTFNELVLQWVQSATRLSKKERCFVLRSVYESATKRYSMDQKAARKAYALLLAEQKIIDTDALRLVVLQVVKESVATEIQKHLALSCTMTLSFGTRLVQRFMSVGDVAVALAAQSEAASRHWRVVNQPRAWLLSEKDKISFCARSVFSVGKDEELVTFHDELLLDDHYKPCRIARTLLATCSNAEEEVWLTFPFYMYEGSETRDTRRTVSASLAPL
ncbi:hypothetical protein ERJ75_001248300 [Trypanosoma vivax]|nr:hypothetical protein TRVL_04629 [Trypanosoma vivax]KAH8609154.1 hypothetical protein ERJ75_001248300 [Trypanosoma vivax]